jgi:hypothetical protein
MGLYFCRAKSIERYAICRAFGIEPYTFCRAFSIFNLILMSKMMRDIYEKICNTS